MSRGRLSKRLDGPDAGDAPPERLTSTQRRQQRARHSR